MIYDFNHITLVIAISLSYFSIARSLLSPVVCYHKWAPGFIAPSQWTHCRLEDLQTPCSREVTDGRNLEWEAVKDELD